MRIARLAAVDVQWAEPALREVSGGLVYLGKAQTPFSAINVSESQIDWGEDEQALREAKLDTSDQFNPARGPKAELQSLHQHFDKVAEMGSLTNQELQELKESFIREGVKTPCSWDQRRDPNVWADILDTLKKQASTGFPYAHIAKMNIDALNDDVLRVELQQLAIQRLEALSVMKPQAVEACLILDPSFLVRHNLADQVRVFVKNEIHPKRKAIIGKWRNIASVSLVDRLVETFLVRNQDMAEIKGWREMSSKSGFGLTDVDMSEISRFCVKNKLTVSSDASGWDSSVPRMLLMLDAERRVWLCDNPSEGWATALRNVFIASAYRVLMTSDGRMYTRVVPGGQASGRKVTSSGNGAMRRALDVLVGRRLGVSTFSMCMGDDCVTHFGGDAGSVARAKENYAREALNRTGVVLTDVSEREGRVEFCSHEFDLSTGLAYPVNPLKPLANLASKRVLVEFDQNYDQFLRTIRHHPDRVALTRVADSLRARRRAPEKNDSENGVQKHVAEGEERGSAPYARV